MVVTFLKPFLVSISPGTPGFGPRPVRVGFMVIKVALGNIPLPVIHFSLVSNIPPVLPAHSSIYSDGMQSDNSQHHSAQHLHLLFYVAVRDFFLCYSLFFFGTLLVMYTPVCDRMPSVCSGFDTPVSELFGVPHVSDAVALQEGCAGGGGSGV